MVGIPPRASRRPTARWPQRSCSSGFGWPPARRQAWARVRASVRARLRDRDNHHLLSVWLSDSLSFSLSLFPCLHVSMSPCLPVSLSACLPVSPVQVPCNWPVPAVAALRLPSSRCRTGEGRRAGRRACFPGARPRPASEPTPRRPTRLEIQY